jgi:threonine/homoserine/homoserine lactone efflux protein
LGLTTGILIHTLIVVLGVGSVLALNPNILRLIELLGASFLIYLAIQSWKTKHTIIVQPKKKVSQNLYITGFVMNISNPKVSLFFLSFFPGFLFHESWSNAIQFLILGGIFYVQALFVFFSFSILAHRLTNKLQSFKQDDRWNKFQALILFIISLILIYP